jgi:double-stranded uracil-DNA glycosylase
MTVGGAEVWVVPNPSGLNRAFTIDDLVSAYCELRIARDRLIPGVRKSIKPDLRQKTSPLKAFNLQ